MWVLTSFMPQELARNAIAASPRKAETMVTCFFIWLSVGVLFGGFGFESATAISGGIDYLPTD